MTAGLVLGVAVAGAGGAVARHAIDAVSASRRPTSFPYAILLVNVTGSLLLGLLVGLTLFQAVADPWRVVGGTGFCGGFTTFSTTSLDSVRLAQGGQRSRALLNAFGTLVLSVGAAGLGLVLAAL